jgi:hypothetical protein
MNKILANSFIYQPFFIGTPGLEPGTSDDIPWMLSALPIELCTRLS